MKKTDPRIKQLERLLRVENMRMETMAYHIGVATRTVFNWIDGRSRISRLASPRVDMFLRKAKRIAQVDAAERAQSLLAGK
ncbi:MAG: hypothetical protein M0R06_14990 [Sphaerochaeta sp.]|nr:hypothetical protein [Sphaerochaeta sp.]